MGTTTKTTRSSNAGPTNAYAARYRLRLADDTAGHARRKVRSRAGTVRLLIGQV